MGYVGYLCILFYPFLHFHFLALFYFVTMSMITLKQELLIKVNWPRLLRLSAKMRQLK